VTLLLGIEYVPIREAIMRHKTNEAAINERVTSTTKKKKPPNPKAKVHMMMNV
jgi:hypothetical protein